jgi:hypothetical protein
MKKHYYAFTPAGTLLYETEAETEKKCIAKLLKAAAHMPYGTWENFKVRGYTVKLVC